MIKPQEQVNRYSTKKVNPQPAFKWTEENLKFLKGNFQKMSYSQLAGMLGTTKNSIVGKVNRLGLRKSAPVKTAAQHTRVSKLGQDILNLKPRMCRGINDDKWCKKPVTKGSFCKEHRDLYYVKGR